MQGCKAGFDNELVAVQSGSQVWVEVLRAAAQGHRKMLSAVSAAKEQMTAAEANHDSLKLDLILLVVIALIGAILYLPMLGSVGVLDPTDSFFVESGREMIETGRYITAIDNYQPWLDKPILAFWLIVLSYKILGVSPFAARLVSAVPGIILACVSYCGVRPFAGRKISFLASTVFLTCPLVCIIAHLALTDMTFSLLLACAFFSFFRYLRLGQGKWHALSYLFCGFAVLCKGPVALVLMELAIFLNIGLTQRPSNWLRAFLQTKPFIGALIVLAVNLPWYWAAIGATHGDFFYDFFIRQNFGRMMGTVNHQEPWWFYVPVFFGGLFPWSLVLFSSAKQISSAWQSRRQPEACQALMLFCLSWAVAVLAIFGPVKTKLPTYLLPMVPAVSYLVAVQLNNVIAAGKKLTSWMWASCLAMAGLTALLVAHDHLSGYVKSIVTTNFLLACIIVASLGALAWLLYKRANKFAVVVIASVTGLSCAVFVPTGLQAFYDQHQRGFDLLAMKARQSGAAVAIYVAEQPSLSWVLRRGVPRLYNTGAVKVFAQSPAPGHVMIVPANLFESLVTGGCSPTLIERQGKWLLVGL
jgi:4-amino-4-deoxy-L-arabinose transferase-like glycosyltransferase